MKYSHTIISFTITQLAIICFCSLASSMEKRGDIGGKTGLPSLRAAVFSSSASPSLISPTRDSMLSPIKVIPHPKELSHDQLTRIFDTKHEHDLPSTIQARKLEVLIAGEKVTVYAAPKSHKDDEVRKLLKDANTTIIGKFTEYLIENRGDAHTLAAAGLDRATIAGFILYYVNSKSGSEVPITAYHSPGSTIYIAFAAKYEDLPEVGDEATLPSSSATSPAAAAASMSSPPTANTGKEKGKEKEEKEAIGSPKKSADTRARRASEPKDTSTIETLDEIRKDPKLETSRVKTSSTVTPLRKLSNRHLEEIFIKKDEAVLIDEETQAQYKVTLTRDDKVAAILTLLQGKDGARYYAKFIGFVGDSSPSATLATQGKDKQVCAYQIMKEGTFRDSKAKAPEGASVERPEDFHRFTISFYSTKS